MPKRTWFERLFNVGADSGMRQEILANMYKEYMIKVNNGETPDVAAKEISSRALDNHMADELAKPNRQFAVNPDTKQRYILMTVV
jgi:hypothetical protein